MDNNEKPMDKIVSLVTEVYKKKKSNNNISHKGRHRMLYEILDERRSSKENSSIESKQKSFSNSSKQENITSHNLSDEKNVVKNLLSNDDKKNETNKIKSIRINKNEKIDNKEDIKNKNNNNNTHHLLNLYRNDNRKINNRNNNISENRYNSSNKDENKNNEQKINNFRNNFRNQNENKNIIKTPNRKNNSKTEEKENLNYNNNINDKSSTLSREIRITTSNRFTDNQSDNKNSYKSNQSQSNNNNKSLIKLNSSDNENIEKNPKTNQIDNNNQLNLNKFSPYKKNQIILNEDKEDNNKNITVSHQIKSPNIRESIDNNNDNNKNYINIDSNTNINIKDNVINNKESSSSEYEEDSNSSEIILNNQNYNNINNEDDDEDVSEEEKKDQFNNSESLSRFNDRQNVEIISSDEENNDEKLNIFNEPFSPFNSDLNVKKKNNTDDDFHSRHNSILEKLQKNEIKRKDSTLNVPSSSSIRNIFTSPEKLNVVEEEGKIPSFDIDDYDFIKPIGEGSFGKIYLIENFETHEQYALKKIICHSLDEVKQFQREFELMYSKAHDNIMKIYKVQYKCLDFTTYSIYVLMELAIYDWNTEITNRKINKQFYTEKEIVDILKQIVGALYFLEKNNIAHRDIKP